MSIVYLPSSNVHESKCFHAHLVNRSQYNSLIFAVNTICRVWLGNNGP